jgi:thiamine monophosphate synthase
VPLVRRAGGSGVAVVSGILNDPDVRRSTARYAAAWAPGGQS